MLYISSRNLFFLSFLPRMSVTDEIVGVLKELRTLVVINELETVIRRLSVLADKCGTEVNQCKKLTNELLRRHLQHPANGRWPDSSAT